MKNAASKRPYKEAWSVDKTMVLIRSESDKHFEPKLVALLEPCLPEILEIKGRWQDD